MRRKWTEEEKKKRKEMIKANPEMKRGGKKIWIDLGDIRIVKSDQWNWTVEEKKKGIWNLVGYYGSPEGAIKRVASLALEPIRKMEVNELLTMFQNSIDNMIKLIMLKKKEDK